jgi:hydrogenase maturation protein HypF
MMPVYHIHINGMVQGVGFRPFVHKLAIQMQIDGWVSNGSDGVHIICSCEEEKIHAFCQRLVEQPPVLAIITEHTIRVTDTPVAKGFFIKPSTTNNKIQMLITPDVAICDDCRREIRDPENRRYNYSFTTCVNCGPRYSITTALPYDRMHTTMRHLHQCNQCTNEYMDVMDARHHSQTNSCPDCAIALHLYDGPGKEIVLTKEEAYLQRVKKILQQGDIIAVKGVGGYLLLCDATKESTAALLRKRKQRPTKPFALLYADLEMLYADADIRPVEMAALKDKAAPIVLCRLKKHPENQIAVQQIAPGLNNVGAMLPSSPLLQLIADQFGKPLIATSANLSGSPIIYEDESARYWLSGIADYILTYDRDIVAPQDDSLVQFTSRGQKIILRRSRGMAPNYYPIPFLPLPNHTLAMGAELKSAFAIAHNDHLFISQFLGDQQSVESQQSFDASLHHVSALLGFKAKHIIADKHPRYHVSQRGRELSTMDTCSFTQVQHHEAHFASVMAENNLFEQKEPVLGIVWDGAGYGDDGQVWGGEIFLYDQGEIKRTAHLAYFPQLLGDKMSKEPRLSALSLLRNYPSSQKLLQKHFTDKEWTYYQQLLQQPQTVMTSSMGRLMDGVACLLGITPVTSYEGEAAMQLEALAKKCTYHSYDYYHLPLADGVIDWRQLINELIEDWSQKESNEVIAWKFFYSLARAISQLSDHYFIDKIAFSGGVFQNSLLVDMVIEMMHHKRHLFFHKQLSPNDECISLGQLAWYSMFGDSGRTTGSDQKKTHNVRSSAGWQVF